MSYDLAISVKIEGCGKYVMIAEPEYANPTYNLGKMFRACMDWDYNQTIKKENGLYEVCYYPCDFVIQKVERGIKELHTNRKEYEKYNPENGWGSLGGAIETLESLRKCIYEQVEEKEIPLECLYFSW